MMDIKVVKLKDISIGKGEYGIGASSVERNHKLPTYLRITDINDDGSINYNGLTSVDDPNYKKYILKENDIVFARTGASTGRAFFYEQKHGELVYAGFLIKFTLDSRKVIPKFMKYYTQSEIYKGWVRAFTGGSTRGNINAKTYGEMDILLPSTQQQNYLVKVLEQFDDKIEVNNKINENLEELAQALYKHWFVDFEFYNEVGKPYKSNGGNMIESELGLIPIGWKTHNLGDIANINYGKNHPTKNLLDSGYPVFGGNGIIGYTNSYLYDSPQVLVSCRGAASGKVHYSLPKSFVTNNSLIIESKQEDIKYEFIKEHSFYYEYYKFVTGSAQPQITVTSIKNAKIIIPTSEIIEEFTCLMKPINEKLIEIYYENEKLAEMRDLLLPKLMSGEIRIPVKE